jgi:DNA-binding NarL/FixJ family response regulator
MMEKIKVILSDIQVLFREGIHFILSGEEDFEVTGEASNNEEAIALIETNPPDIAILGMQNRRLLGPDITRRIKRNNPAVSVILTIDRKDADLTFAAMKSGASACLPKDTDPEFLVETARLTAKGNRPIVESLLVPEIASKVIAEFDDFAILGEQVDNALTALSPEETDILDDIAAGSKFSELVAKLNVTEDDLRLHLKEIVDKLVANDQARALIEAAHLIEYAQRSLPSLARSVIKTREPSADYVTKAEFNELKQSLLDRINSLKDKVI